MRSACFRHVRTAAGRLRLSQRLLNADQRLPEAQTQSAPRSFSRHGRWRRRKSRGCGRDESVGWGRWRGRTEQKRLENEEHSWRRLKKKINSIGWLVIFPNVSRGEQSRNEASTGAKTCSMSFLRHSLVYSSKGNRETFYCHTGSAFQKGTDKSYHHQTLRRDKSVIQEKQARPHVSVSSPMDS